MPFPSSSPVTYDFLTLKSEKIATSEYINEQTRVTNKMDEIITDITKRKYFELNVQPGGYLELGYIEDGYVE